MRWRLVVGCGIAGAVAGTALGQFAVDRAPQAAPSGIPAAAPQSTAPGGLAPAGFQPAAPAYAPAYTPPVGGVTAAAAAATTYPSAASVAPERPLLPPKLEIETALGANHPWAVRPEHGPFMICVKSYSRPHIPSTDDPGPSARQLAEALAGEIRSKHNVNSLLFEYISDERKAEAMALATERERGRTFANQIDTLRKQSTLQGMEFLDPDNKIRYKTVTYRDQIAVFVGGFRTAEDARKYLDVVHSWKAPVDKILMDGAVAGRWAPDGKNVFIEKGYLNPFLSASVAPNPSIPRQATPPGPRLDPALIKWNADNPYNLLKATKNWTIAVKSFNAPVEIVSKESDVQSAMKKLTGNKGANALLAAAVQAEHMAKMLREMKGPGGQSLGIEAFVLHCRSSSLVTVGQFDNLNDPALVQMQNLLKSMKLAVSEDKMGSKPVANAPKLFEEQLVPMPIPKG